MIKRYFLIILVLSFSISSAFASGNRENENQQDPESVENVTTDSTAVSREQYTDEFATRENKSRILIGVSLSGSDMESGFIESGISDYIGRNPETRLQMVDAEDDAQTQLAQIDDLVINEIDALIVVPADFSIMGEIIQKARDAQIALVIANRLPQADYLSGINAFVGSDFFNVGKKQAEWATLSFNGTESAGIIMGSPGNEQMRLLTLGNLDELENNNVSVLAKAEGYGVRDRSMNIVGNWLDNGVVPDLVLCNNAELAIGALMAARSRGIPDESLVITGVGISPDVLEVLGNGVDATFSLNIFDQGYKSAEVAFRLARGETMEKLQWIESTLVLPENRNEYLELLLP